MATYPLITDVELSEARCTSPFSVLGLIQKEEGLTFTAWCPDASRVQVLPYGSIHMIAELDKVASFGLFSADFSGRSQEDIYVLNIEVNGQWHQVIDPYQFKEEAFHAVHFIDHQPQNLYRQGGAQIVQLFNDIQGVRFTVYAPNASAVSVVGDFNFWDGRRHPMQKTDLGYWVLVIPNVDIGSRYKYQIKDHYGKELPHKADPLGFEAEPYPSHASKIFDHSQYQWQDEAWMQRDTGDIYQQPMAIYEVHLGSWKRPNADSDARYLSYKELATDLISYVKEMGFTHLELMPISEYPFDGSWGYQPVGLFAPTSRYGSPDDFKYFVDQCHQAGLGIIIDWVPAHFPEDGHGLARFDGSCVYEYEDPRRGWHPDWNSCIYDYGKDTVRQFLVANALFWLEHYHIDGLRVDAVASMLYLDYSRKDGQWIPNVHGGNENYEAISFLKWFNREVYKQFPKAVTIAEESTSFAKVSRPLFDGGLGFGFKWNMGWMHDSLEYIQKDPAYRNYHHGDMTFSMVYAYDENFVLPISHDEVVHGKRSLLGKMPGDEWQATANLKAYIAFMYGHPGKKLNFMGNEIGQTSEWNHDGSLDWWLLEYEKHKGIQSLYKKLNSNYVSYPALHELDHNYKGFEWIDLQNAEQSVFSFVRLAKEQRQKVYVVANFTPVPRDNFRIGVKDKGCYKLILNTDELAYWGSDYSTPSKVQSTGQPWNNQPDSIEVNLPPLSTLFFVYE